MYNAGGTAVKMATTKLSKCCNHEDCHIYCGRCIVMGCSKCASCKRLKVKYVNAGGIPSVYRNQRKCKECGKEGMKVPK